MRKGVDSKKHFLQLNSAMKWSNSENPLFSAAADVTNTNSKSIGSLSVSLYAACVYSVNKGPRRRIDKRKHHKEVRQMAAAVNWPRQTDGYANASVITFKQ